MSIAKQAIFGFAAAHGRLPCPVPFDQVAIEPRTCRNFTGTLPAVTLGLPGSRNKYGALLDGWNQPLHYIVSAVDHATEGNQGQPDFVTSGEMQQVGMSHLAAELQICAEATTSKCPNRHLLANQIPMLLFSTGKPIEPSSYEAENLDADTVYISRDYSQAEAYRFDDLLTWIPENLLFYRMMQAGVLP